MTDTPTKSTWRVIVEWGIYPMVIGLVVATMIWWFGSKSDGATPGSTSAFTSYSAGIAPTDTQSKRRCVPPDHSDKTCKEWSRSWAKKKVRQFKKGKLGTAEGLHLPRRWNRALNRYDREHRTTFDARRDGDWWKWPFEAAVCTPMVPGYQMHCDAAKEHFKEYADKQTKIIVLCGGLAAVGALAGGGAAGAGKGALGCLWTNMALAGFFHMGPLWRQLPPAQKAQMLLADVGRDSNVS